MHISMCQVNILKHYSELIFQRLFCHFIKCPQSGSNNFSRISFLPRHNLRLLEPAMTKPVNAIYEQQLCRLIESMMVLRQGNLRQFFRLFSLMRGSAKLETNNLKTSRRFPC